MAGPTPHRAWTGSGCRKASSWPGSTTWTPLPKTGPSGDAFGLAASDASLARNFVGATPTEQVSRSSSSTWRRNRAPIVGPSPCRRWAPLTSRNASSSDSGSTSGVKERKIAITRSLTSA